MSPHNINHNPNITEDLLHTLSLIIQNRSDPSTPSFCEEFLSMWKSVSMVSDSLFLKTSNLMLRLSFDANSIDFQEIPYGCLVEDPLLLFQIDISLLLPLPSLFDLLLRLFHHFFERSTRFYQERRKRSMREHASYIKALVYGQESSLIQLLLEMCINHQLLAQNKGVVEQVQSLTFAYIHQKFIEKPKLIRLIHLQMFPEKLIPLLINGVPSMHICLEIIPELLIKPSINYILFALALSASVIKKYPLPATLGIAHHIAALIKTHPLLKYKKIAKTIEGVIRETFPNQQFDFV
jgi:hypothetical protein